MKLLTSKLLLAGCMSVGLLASPLKAAEDPLKVAVVDVDKLMQASKSAKQLITELEKQRTKFQEEVSKHETKLPIRSMLITIYDFQNITIFMDIHKFMPC